MGEEAKKREVGRTVHTDTGETVRAVGDNVDREVKEEYGPAAEIFTNSAKGRKMAAEILDSMGYKDAAAHIRGLPIDNGLFARGKRLASRKVSYGGLFVTFAVGGVSILVIRWGWGKFTDWRQSSAKPMEEMMKTPNVRPIRAAT